MKRIWILLVAIALVAGCSGEMEADEKKEVKPAPEKKEKNDSHYDYRMELLDVMGDLKDNIKRNASQFDRGHDELTSINLHTDIINSTTAIVKMKPPKEFEEKHKEMVTHLLNSNQTMLDATEAYEDGDRDTGVEKVSEALEEVHKAFKVLEETME